MTRKTVVIGMDGVPLRLIRELTDSGYMPNCAELRSKGYLSSMHSAIPEVSNVNCPVPGCGQSRRIVPKGDDKQLMIECTRRPELDHYVHHL